MGARWEGAAIRASASDLARLATELLAVADDARPRIRVTLAALNHPAAPDVWLLELSGINKNPLQVASGNDQPPGVEIPGPALAIWRTRASATLAVVASCLIGRSTWLFHSDGRGESASVRLEAGQVLEAEWSNGEAEGGCGRAAVAGFRPYLPALSHVDEVLDMYYNEPARCRAWRLMDRRTLLPEPTVLE